MYITNSKQQNLGFEEALKSTPPRCSHMPTGTCTNVSFGGIKLTPIGRLTIVVSCEYALQGKTAL